MRTFIIGLSLVLAFTQVMGPASAAAVVLQSANDVMPGCRSLLTHPPRRDGQGRTEKENDCVDGIGAATLMHEGFKAIWGPAGDPDHLYDQPLCIPKSATMGQQIAVVVKYIDEHPEDMHLEFVFLAYEALLKAWPCKQ